MYVLHSCEGFVNLPQAGFKPLNTKTSNLIEVFLANYRSGKSTTRLRWFTICFLRLQSASFCSGNSFKHLNKLFMNQYTEISDEK